MPDPLPFTALPEEVDISSKIIEETPRLTRALAAGNEDAWRNFHDTHRGRLRAYLSAIWHGPDEALDDLVQETFLRAVKHMRVFPDQETLWSWLTVLARSATADAGRKRGRFRRFLDRLAREPRASIPHSPVELDKATARLPESAAELIRLKYEDELSVHQIAHRLGVTEKAIESRLTRARKLLQKELNRLSP